MALKATVRKQSSEQSLHKIGRTNNSHKGNTYFLALILTLNNFIFNSKKFLQNKGCVIGTICAPSHKNIFMDHFKWKYIYALTAGKSLASGTQ